MNGAIDLFGRLALSAIFVLSAIHKIFDFDATAKLMASKGIPEARSLCMAAIACLLLGSLSVILGYKTRFGALLLLIFLAAATYYFHDFWNFSGKAAQGQQIHFLKNIALMGAMLMLVARGAGSLSLDTKHRARRLQG